MLPTATVVVLPRGYLRGIRIRGIRILLKNTQQKRARREWVKDMHDVISRYFVDYSTQQLEQHLLENLAAKNFQDRL